MDSRHFIVPIRDCRATRDVDLFIHYRARSKPYLADIPSYFYGRERAVAPARMHVSYRCVHPRGMGNVQCALAHCERRNLTRNLYTYSCTLQSDISIF